MKEEFCDVRRNKPILDSCAVGSRSKPVAEYLSMNGFKDMYNMAGCTVGWYRNGFPLQR